jgi:hypothetical protein
LEGPAAKAASEGRKRLFRVRTTIARNSRAANRLAGVFRVKNGGAAAGCPMGCVGASFSRPAGHGIMEPTGRSSASCHDRVGFCEETCAAMNESFDISTLLFIAAGLHRA